MDEEWGRWRSYARNYFATRVRDPHAVDELTQEVCLRTLESVRDGRCARLGAGWVHGISWRLLADTRRRYATGLPAKLAAEPWALDEACATPRCSRVSLDGEEFELPRVLRVLDECVDALPESWRPIMRARMEGRPLTEIASLFGTNENVVKLRLYRGRRRLRQAILERLREDEDVVEVAV